MRMSVTYRNAVPADMNFSEILSASSVDVTEQREKASTTTTTPANFARKNRSRLTGLLKTADAVPSRISRARDDDAAYPVTRRPKTNWSASPLSRASLPSSPK